MFYSRKKLDANRDIEVGAQNDPIAMEAWETFHNYIQVSQQEMGRGILFDVHKYAWLSLLEIPDLDSYPIELLRRRDIFH